ncbi:MAG: hypothetical protein MUP66_00685 [Candidatus Nanohaloarchaeota archaeon QJJ-5]|nr:hypothetical protein [Candidatus Nanohaloarchaeota archaeon QJJ-5]
MTDTQHTKDTLREAFATAYEETDGTIGIGETYEAAKDDATEYILEEEGLKTEDDLLVQFYTPEEDTETFIDEELDVDPDSVNLEDETAVVMATYTVEFEEDETATATSKSPGAPGDNDGDRDGFMAYDDPL